VVQQQRRGHDWHHAIWIGSLKYALLLGIQAAQGERRKVHACGLFSMKLCRGLLSHGGHLALGNLASPLEMFRDGIKTSFEKPHDET